MAPPQDASAFGQQVAAVLGSLVADDFVGAYIVAVCPAGRHRGRVPGTKKGPSGEGP